jgi:hypothetical protein
VKKALPTWTKICNRRAIPLLGGDFFVPDSLSNGRRRIIIRRSLLAYITSYGNKMKIEDRKRRACRGAGYYHKKRRL